MVIAPARRAGDPGSNPARGENFSFKLTRKYNCFSLKKSVTKEEKGKYLKKKLIRCRNHYTIR